MALGITIGVAAASFLFFLRWPGKGLALLLFLLPFSVALNPSPGVDLQLLRLLAPMWWLVVLVKHPKEFLRQTKKPHALLLWLFLIIATLATFFSTEPIWSLRKVLYLWSLTPFLPAMSVVVNRVLVTRYSLLVTLFWGGIIVSLIGIAQFAAQFFIGTDTLFQLFVKILPYTQGKEFGALITQYPSWFVHIAGRDYLRAFAFFPDPHIFAFYLSILAALALPFLFSAKSRKEFFLYAIRYTLYTACLLLTFSRGGYLGFLVSTIAIVVLYYCWRRSGRVAAFVALGIGMLLVLFVLGAPFINRFTSSFDVMEGSNVGRLEIWKDALQKSVQHPFGVGLGNYAVTTDDALKIRNPVTAHNLYLDILLETGWLGLAAFINFLVYTAHAMMRFSKTALCIGVLAALAGFSTHAFFENPLFAPGIFLLILFVVALLTGAKQDINKK